MPSKSKAQARLMAAAAHNPGFAKKVGIPTSVAKEFNQADKGKKFGTGGKISNREKLNNPKVNHGKTEYFKEGGSMATKKMHAEKGEMKADVKQDKAMIKKAVGMHDKQLHGGKKTNLTKLARGGGIEVRGKTKGKMITMKKGGCCGR